MKIDIKSLKSKNACAEGIKWLESLKTLDAIEVIEAGIKAERLWYLQWGLSKMMTKTQCCEWAIFCADQVIGIFEAKFPEDDRPRKAIKAAKAYLNNKSKTIRQITAAAYDAAYAAAAADYAAAAADYAAAADDYAAAADDRKEMQVRCIWKGYQIISGDVK